jgi:hypothetical protein
MPPIGNAVPCVGAFASYAGIAQSLQGVAALGQAGRSGWKKQKRNDNSLEQAIHECPPWQGLVENASRRRASPIGQWFPDER